MRTLVLFLVLVSARIVLAQSTEISDKPYSVIVSISAAGEERTVKAVRTLSEERSTGFSYLAYCNRQKCLILTADKNVFPNSDKVLAYLDSLYPGRILAIKDQSLEQFFTQCSFADPKEYEYFKKNYGK